MAKKFDKQKCFSSVVTKNSNWEISRIQLLLKDKMGLRKKKFNIFGIRFVGGRVHEKLINRRELPKKGMGWVRGGGGGQFTNLRRGLARKRGGVFEGVDTLMHTMLIHYRHYYIMCFHFISFEFSMSVQPIFETSFKVKISMLHTRLSLLVSSLICVCVYIKTYHFISFTLYWQLFR